MSPGTFTAEQLERRAREHEHGNGPGILRGASDAAFAERIRALHKGTPMRWLPSPVRTE